MAKMTQQFLLSKIELIVNKLMAMDEPETNDDSITSDQSHKKGLISRDFGIKEWDWPQGVGLYGLNSLQKHYGDHRYDLFLDKWFNDNILSGLPSKNINTTAPFLTLIDYTTRYDNQTYKNLCLDRAKWLMNDLPKTEEGGFQHVTSAIGDRNGVKLNENELWVDTLFMAVLFLNKMGQTHQREDWINESIKQLLIHIKYLFDPKTCLFYHGWTFKDRTNFGGVFWCRGNSWFTFGLLEYLEISGTSLPSGLRSYLEDTFISQAKSLQALQGDSGLWHTVLTDPTSYEEVSGSAAIATGLLKGIKLGLLDDSYKRCADKAIFAICENIDTDGTVMNVSAGTGMGEDSQHYKDILIIPMAYGQSLALVALCSALE